MVNPVTGPFTETILTYANVGGFNKAIHSVSRTWYRQAPPFTKPLVYTLNDRRVLSQHHSNTSAGATYSVAPTFVQSYGLDAQNRAYAKLMDALATKSQLAVDIAEYQRSLDLISGHATTLWRFARALSRFNFPECDRILRVQIYGSEKRRLRTAAKSFGSNFLSYTYGWKPLVTGIGDAVEFLQAPIPVGEPVVGKGSQSKSLYHDAAPKSGTWNRADSITTRVRQATRVTVENPNLYLANSLGFVNPASFLWERLPFSFVADWVGNVGQFLSSFSDFAGLSLTDSATTFYQVWNRSETYEVPNGYPAGYSAWRNSKGVFVRRTLGLAGPVLALKPLGRLSWNRAAQAVSLLTQALDGDVHRFR